MRHEDPDFRGEVSIAERNGRTEASGELPSRDGFPPWVSLAALRLTLLRS